MSEHPDWSVIRAEYESGSSLREVAAKYGVSKSAVGNRKYRERWKEPVNKWTPPDNPKSKTRDINALQRVHLALKFHAQRLPWDEIAQRAGYGSRGAAHNAVRREYQRLIPSDVQELREQELAILDVIHQKVWPLVVPDAENEDPNLWAVDRLLALSEARRQLLNLNIKPEDALSQQSYTKRIILTHQTGGKDDASDT
jgi:AraC-like DNA-binding protein